MSIVNAMAKISNIDLWNKARDLNSHFESITAEATKDLFTDSGLSALKNTAPSATDEFIGIALTIGLQLFDNSTIKDIFTESGIVQTYDVPYGEYIARETIAEIPSIDPQFLGLSNGSSPDQFKFRQAETKERFFRRNFAFQNFVSVRDDAFIRRVMLAEYGVGSWVAEVMNRLDQSYRKQRQTNVFELLNEIINSTDWVLKDTQKVELDAWDGDNVTAEQLLGLIETMKNIATMFDTTITSDAFNAYGFDTATDNSDLVLLLRPGIKTKIALNVELGAFNPETLTLPYEVREVPNFGGMKPYKEEALTTPLYPVYDSLGSVIGYAESEDASEATVAKNEVYWKDPNENVIGLLVQKGVIFEYATRITNEPARNVAGKYTNYWLSTDGLTGINYDPAYVAMTINAPSV